VISADCFPAPELTPKHAPASQQANWGAPLGRRARSIALAMSGPVWSGLAWPGLAWCAGQGESILGRGTNGARRANMRIAHLSGARLTLRVYTI